MGLYVTEVMREATTPCAKIDEINAKDYYSFCTLNLPGPKNSALRKIAHMLSGCSTVMIKSALV